MTATAARTSRQKEIVAIFPSRQFGKLLTINLSPIEGKTCSFNCVYCCTGSTMIRKNELSPEETYSWEEVSSELESAFPRHVGGGYDGICVAGTGEPTIYPGFAEFTELLLKLRDAHFPGLKTVLFSNCSRIGDPEIRAAMGRYDRKMCKLDAGDEATFRRINLPVPGLTLESIVDGLSKLDNVELSTGIIEGEQGNLSSLMSQGFLSAVARIRPVKIDLYEFDRPAFRGKNLLRNFRCSLESLNTVAAFLEANLEFPVKVNRIRKETSRGKHPLLMVFRPGFRELTPPAQAESRPDPVA
jgi:wyosine [tRNA(Phe)-imidazoG37] synthetase (radical SAM superfamily)